MKSQVHTDATVVKKAAIHTYLAIVDKESKLTDPWRRIMLRKVPKRTWAMLDEFGQSVLDTVVQVGDEGVVEQWGKWFRHPSFGDYRNALVSYQKHS